MFKKEDAMLLFKFGEYKWIKQLQDGEISFSCPGNYIDIAKRTGNDEQGDIDEGIFARLKRKDLRIKKAMSQLKDDLEIIPDGEYVKLRRKSTYFIPTFCFYSYRVQDALDTNIHKAGMQSIDLNFDEKMFNGFCSDQIRNVLSIGSYPTILTFTEIEAFKSLLVGQLIKRGIYHYKMNHINYTEFSKDEFYIEPTNKRDELFYKFPKYSYQREARVCLYNNPRENIKERLNINIGSLHNYSMLQTKKIGIRFWADVVKL